jgi:ATP-dependent DNA helicase RecG
LEHAPFAKRLLPDDGIKDGIKDGLKDGIKLNKIQQEMLDAILKDRNITHEALAEKVGISVRNTEKNIAHLKEEGLLKRIGSRKTGYWKIESNDIQAI